MEKLLQIDTNDQIPNMILKSQADNKVKQTTDKANGIPFVADIGEEPVFKHDGYYHFADGTKIAGKNPSGFKIGTRDFILAIDFEYENLDYEYTYPFGLMGAVSEMAFGFRNHTSTGTLQLLITSTGNDYTVYTAIPATHFSANVRLKLVTLVHNGLMYFIVNNEYIGRVFFTTDIYGEDFLEFKIHETFASNSSPIKFYGASLIMDTYDERLSISTPLNTTVSMDHITKTFNYYHRYKDDGFNKLYLSSKYLKDAVIDDNNVITSINDIFGWEFAFASGDPKWTKFGFDFETARMFVQGSDLKGITDFGTGDFYVGAWVNAQTLNTTNYWLNLGGNYYAFRSGRIGFYDTTWHESPSINIFQGKYAYVSYFRKDGIFYMCVDGVLRHSFVYADDMTTAQTFIAIGGTAQAYYGLIDDFLINKSSIIDPTGFVIGDKVFEPPMRGGFDSIIKQY